MDEPLRLIVVDDRVQDIDLLARTVEALSKDATVVGTATSGKDALALAETTSFDVAVVDFRMPGMDGLELATRLKEHDPTCTVLILTAYDDQQEAIRAHPAVDHYLEKMALDSIDDVLRTIAEERSDAPPEKARKGGLFRRR